MINRDYFQDGVEWDGTQDYTPEFKRLGDLDGFEAAPGVILRPQWGKNLMASYVTFAQEALAPLHQHAQEQFSLVLSGSLYFTVGNQSQWMYAGDIVTIPAGVPHSALAGKEGAVAVDVFSPPRDGFRELIQANRRE